MTERRRKEDNIENFVQENASSIAKQAEETPNAAKRNRGNYKCTECGKEYDNFQALGGHRAAHKTVGIYAGASISGETHSQPKLHHCKICGKGFPIGQALGGHMRRHWRRKKSITEDTKEERNYNTALVPYQPSDSVSSSSDSILSSSEGKEVLKSDLNLTLSSCSNSILSSSEGKEVSEFGLNLTLSSSSSSPKSILSSSEGKEVFKFDLKLTLSSSPNSILSSSEGKEILKFDLNLTPHEYESMRIVQLRDHKSSEPP